MSIFNYEFMNRALWVGALVAVMSPLIGQTIVLKRMSMVGDAIAHTTLAGVAIGLILNIDPLISAMVTALIGVFLIDVLRSMALPTLQFAWKEGDIETIICDFV